MTRHHVEIRTEGARGVVAVDGKTIDCVRAYTVRHEAGGLPVVTLELAPVRLTSAGDPEVRGLPQPPDWRKRLHAMIDRKAMEAQVFIVWKARQYRRELGLPERP